MQYDELKLDKMFLWLRDSLPENIWFPEGEKKLSEDQAIYIERIMEEQHKCLQGLEINEDFTKVRKVNINFEPQPSIYENLKYKHNE